MSRPRVVIVGGGFAGLNVAKQLSGAPCDVTLIDRSNHFVFQPLLYQVATAGLSPADISAPIRRILRSCKNLESIMAEVVGVDMEYRRVVTRDHGEVPFDYLVLATGVRHAYFGRDDWAAHAPGLKSIADATEIRRRVLIAFERAETSRDEVERAAWLTFVIVGGGPTGVEMAGAIAELAHRALARDFDRIDPRRTRIILLEGLDRLLTSFSPALSERAKKDLEAMGVEVALGTRVTDVTADAVSAGERVIPARTVIWAAGVQSSPAGSWLHVETDRAGRVPVQPDLTVAALDRVWVIGDCALVTDVEGRQVPGVAQPAMQEGTYVGRAIARQLKGLPAEPPFRYNDLGSMATIGRSRAVGVVFGSERTGLVAWLLWMTIHLRYLVSFRSQVLVFIQWAWAYLFWESGARLITPYPGERDPAERS